MKSETVTLSGPANPLLAGLQHYLDVSPPALGIGKRYQRPHTPPERGRQMGGLIYTPPERGRQMCGLIYTPPERGTQMCGLISLRLLGPVFPPRDLLNTHVFFI